MKKVFELYIYGLIPAGELKGRVTLEMGFLPDRNWVVDFLQKSFNAKDVILLLPIINNWYKVKL